MCRHPGMQCSWREIRLADSADRVGKNNQGSKDLVSGQDNDQLSFRILAEERERFWQCHKLTRDAVNTLHGGIRERDRGKV